MPPAVLEEEAPAHGFRPAPARAAARAALEPSPRPEKPHILLTEDDPAMRGLLAAILRSLGYRVTQAGNGREALEILAQEAINLIITDWMMPEMDGLEFCRRVRARPSAGYTYIILLTGRQDRGSLVEGMDAGADDFVTKPPHIDELRVRLAAGRRVLELETQLEQRNRRLAAANEQLHAAYERIEQDLIAAAEVQRRLLPRPRSSGGFGFDWLFVPSSHVGGDSFNVIHREDQIVFYLIDVAGHGVQAALTSVSVHQVLSEAGTGPAQGQDPVAVVTELNRRFQVEDLDDARYFTLLYGVLDLRDGRVTLTQAGHPSPLLLRRDGTASMVGDGGSVVGLFPDVEYEAVELRLAPGERLILYSDGVVDCRNEAEEAFTDARLLEVMAGAARDPLGTALRALDGRLREWAGERPFDDDVSVLIIARDDAG